VIKRWQFLTLSVLAAAAIIALLMASEQRAGLVGDLKTENDYLTRRLEQTRDQLQRMAERQVELEKTLQNRTTAPVRGGRTGSLMDMPVTQPSGLTAAAFEQALAGTGLAGLGEALVRAEAATGINALVLAGICALETGWGSSRLARDKNNMAGLGAYDGSEYSAGITFDSRAGSIMFLAELLATHYAPGGKHYGGSHDLAGIGVNYASDPAWAQKVAGCMRVIVEGGWRHENKTASPGLQRVQRARTAM